MEEAQAYEGVYSKPSFLERAKESGPIGMAGLATVLLSVILILAAPHLTLSRRRLLALLGLAFCLEVSGYVVFDYQYIMLNLSLHDAQTIRADCMALLQQQKESDAEERFREVPSSNVDFPASFSHLGAKTVLVMNGTVRICHYTDLNGGQWGVLYDPQRGWSKSGMPREVRPTWHRDLYEFRVRGE